MADVEWVQRELLRHADRVKGFLYTLTADIDAVEDCFQEVFLVAVDKAADFEKGTNFLAWVRSIARFRVLRRIEAGRRQSGRLSSCVVEALADDDDPTEDDWEEERIALRVCIEKLAPRARELLMSRFVQDLKPATIAARANRSVNAVSVSLSKSIGFLRTCMGRRLQSEGRA